FSPDGALVSFIRGNNLCVVDTAGQHLRTLTTDGSEKILNGRLDWVYQEELYGRGNFQAYWWAPDSSRLAFLRLAETLVPNFTVLEIVPVDKIENPPPYRKAGHPNPKVQLGLVAAAGGDIMWVDLGRYKTAEPLIPRVAWAADCSKVAFQ